MFSRTAGAALLIISVLRLIYKYCQVGRSFAKIIKRRLDDLLPHLLPSNTQSEATIVYGVALTTIADFHAAAGSRTNLKYKIVGRSTRGLSGYRPNSTRFPMLLPVHLPIIKNIKKIYIIIPFSDIPLYTTNEMISANWRFCIYFAPVGLRMRSRPLL